MKEDGVFGPKTAAATRKALAARGTERVIAHGAAYGAAKRDRASAFSPSSLTERTKSPRIISVLEE